MAREIMHLAGQLIATPDFLNLKALNCRTNASQRFWYWTSASWCHIPKCDTY